MFTFRSLRRLGALAVVASATTLSPSAGATAVTAIDIFTIVRSGEPGTPNSILGSYEGQPVFYRDGFGDGAEPPSGGSFFNGVAGTYGVLGSYPPGAEAGGRLAMDSALGGPFVNALGFGRTLQRSVLQTDADPTTAAGLKKDFHSFASFGLFDLTMPPLIGDGYGIMFTDGGPGMDATTSLDLFVHRDEDGSLYIRFQEQDYLNGVVNTIERDLLVAPPGLDQVELRLQREDTGTNAVTAAYRFWDDGAPMAGFTEMTNSVQFFKNDRNWARTGFFAVQALPVPVPEPGSLALLLVAGASLVASRRRRS